MFTNVFSLLFIVFACNKFHIDLPTEMIYLILLCIVSPTDVNECSEETKCLGGTCINTDGSYMCRCETGFTHLPEAEQCTGKNHFKHSDHFILVLKCTVKFLISNKLDAKKLLNVQDFNLCLLNNILSKSPLPIFCHEKLDLTKDLMLFITSLTSIIPLKMVNPG